MNGFLILNKPVEKTSFDMISLSRRALGEKRIGHAGTLDPFASGVLILGVGGYTRLLFLFDNLEKEYIATGVFGEAKDTDDRTGKTIAFGDTKNKITESDIESILKNKFTGTVLQKPPIYSAKHVNGRRAYDLAREGVSFTLKDTEITIHNIELLSYDYPNFALKMSVSRGTYIRSIVRDIGESFGHLAYTDSLIRSRIGSYMIDDTKEPNAENILSFSEMFKNHNNIETQIVSDKIFIDKLLSGNTHLIEDITLEPNKYLAFLDKNNALISIVSNNNYKNIYSYVSDKKYIELN